MGQSQFMKRMVKLMKAEKKDPLKSGESFTTLNNVAAREAEHHQLLREYGFPSEQPLEGARYQRYSEHTSDPKSPDGVTHNQPPWIVNEVSEMLYEIPDDDAPSAKIKKALISLNKRMSILKAGGWPRQEGPTPPQPASKLTRRQKIEKQNGVDYPQIEKGKLVRSEGMNYGGAVTPERYQPMEKGIGDVARKVGSGIKGADQAVGRKMRQTPGLGQAMEATDKVTDKVIDTALWGGDRAARGAARGVGQLTGSKTVQDFGKKPDYYPEVKNTTPDMEKGLGDVARKLFGGKNKKKEQKGNTINIKRRPGEASRKVRLRGGFGDVNIKRKPKDFSSKESIEAMNAEARKNLAKPKTDVERFDGPDAKTAEGQSIFSTAPGLKEKYPEDKFLQSLPTSAKPKKDKLPPFLDLEQSLTKRLIKLEKRRKGKGQWENDVEKGLGDVARSGARKLGAGLEGAGEKLTSWGTPTHKRKGARERGRLESDLERMHTSSCPGGPHTGRCADGEGLEKGKKDWSGPKPSSDALSPESRYRKDSRDYTTEQLRRRTDVAPKVPFAESTQAKEYPKPERLGKKPEVEGD